MDLRQTKQILDMKNIQLTELQKNHLPTVDWLIDDARAQGKSTLMAVAFIRKALKNPGRMIYVFDHYGGEMGKRHLMNILRQIVESDEELKHHTKFTKDGIIIG